MMRRVQSPLSLKRMVFFIVAFCASSVLTIILSLVVVNFFIPLAPPPFFMRGSNNPQLKDELIKNYHKRFEGFPFKIPPTDVSISSQGSRDRVYSLSKPFDVLRIICIGDSFTFGWGVEAEESFPKVIERTLLKNGRRTESINLGIPGNNILNDIEILKTKGLSFNPDAVVIEAIRDGFSVRSRNLFFVFFALLSRGIQGLPMHVVKDNNDLNGRERSKETILISQCTDELAQIAREKNIPILLVLLTGGPNNSTIVAMGASKGLVVLDLSKICTTRIISKRDQHPNAEAHRMIGEEIAARLSLLPL